jgi:histidine triad (HIT) family protein
MTESIFTKIIKGEVPSHKIYEDDMTLAFLDIHPATPGYTLVIPKIQVDKFYDLPDDYYHALFSSVKKVAQHMEKVLGQRVFIKILGTEVPHVHVRVFPQDPNHPDGPAIPLADDQELAAMANKLRMVQ